MKKFLPSLLVALVLLTGGNKFALADGASVNLTVKNDGDIVYSGSMALLPAGTISINDSSGNPHSVNADSVLSVVNTADAASDAFNISNLAYYDSFGAFYLKCINVGGNDLCDNWQYKVNDASPSMGMDSEILSGGENVVLYFGDENKAPEPAPTPAPTPVVSSGSSVSGGGYTISNIVCGEGEKFSPTTGQPCTSFIPSPAPVSPSPISPTSYTNLTEKFPGHSSLGNKPTGGATGKLGELKPKLENKAIQNTSAVINSVPPAPVQTATPPKSWWNRFWDNIFSVF